VFFDLFQNGFVKREQKSEPMHEQFAELCQKVFGKNGIETFNSVMKEFYANAGVVPRTTYNRLHEKYNDLKARVDDLEAEIEELRGKLREAGGIPSELMEHWTNALGKCTEINRQFFEDINKFFKQ
jgi:uncharacterized coiled-coil DUF342 family protein